ncbi:universal stress protein [Neptunomonas japonica]|uniref:Universal stress protein A n=1 Tax=Neptunomonas japonica JAMM 1380 TaxID=1441457 RepID=A0A7R6SX56_9GAMM|nr:universal stress protein [Neptunomonas japonica]BBB31141.1 universal stress protein A [Neptunomonas japonica JAMM 1380]
MFTKKVLVALDASDAAEKAFKRGVLIADRMGCELEVLWLITPLPGHAIMRFMALLSADGMQIKQHYHQEKSFLKDVLARWRNDHFSLLIKSCDISHKGLLAPLDWQLLRQAPCPVLLVKRDSLWEGGKIMAAVDPLSCKKSCLQLNQSVLMMAGVISQETKADLQVIVSYAPPMLGADAESQSADMLADNVSRAAHALLDAMKVTAGTYHIGEGPPEYWIPNVAEEQHAALVVIGTHGRGGIKGALLGNTAERILDRLSCDVLVLREGLSGDFDELLNNV